MLARWLSSFGSIRQVTVLLGCAFLVSGLSLIVSHVSLAQGLGGPVVSVTGGLVQGRLLPAPGGAVFKGIPYAAPPIGDLRWREPQPVKAWTGVRQTAEYGADCPPNDASASPHAVPARAISEDCLFLNIWTPEWPSGAKKAVMVWLHGGELYGNTGALNSGSVEQAESSLARHDVVLVSINYRPHLLGLMAHPELTAESPHHSSGNYVILDAIAALRWVHENIAHFGGDPGNVTLFGQSGGARITSFLVTSPLTKGLIQRAIVESGAAAQYTKPIPTLQHMEQVGVLVAKMLNAPSTNTIKYLRGLPASDIAAASKKLIEMRGAGASQVDEGIDGYAITQSPPEVYRSHTEDPVPMIVGSTSRDSDSINGVKPVSPNASQEEVLAWVKGALETFYGQDPDLLERAENVYGLRGAPNEVSTYPPYGPIQQQLGVDLHHRCSVVATAIWHSTVAPTWTFEFTRSVPGLPPLHASELRFVFGFLSSQELADHSAHKLADDIQQYWTNFARTGDPNGPGLPAWPKYEITTKKSIDFTNDGPILRTASRDLACSPFVDKMARLPKPLLVQ